MDIIEIPKENILDIKNLWTELNAFHLKRSSNFKKHFSSLSFEDRCETLTSLEQIVIYASMIDDDYVGYCIASVKNKTGEIDSLYVKKDFRNLNIGKQLTEKALKWLNESDCKDINVYVAQGNESALPFYELFGFKKRFDVLQIRKS